MKKLIMMLVAVLSVSSCSTVGVLSENSYQGFDEVVELSADLPQINSDDLMMY